MFTTLLASTLSSTLAVTVAFTLQAPVGNPMVAAAQDASAPQLSLQQQTNLRCAAAFAVLDRERSAGNPQVEDLPAVSSERGREFFVRAAVQVMDETGAGRDQIGALIMAEVETFSDVEALAAILPSCVVLLDASGL